MKVSDTGKRHTARKARIAARAFTYGIPKITYEGDGYFNGDVRARLQAKLCQIAKAKDIAPQKVVTVIGGKAGNFTATLSLSGRQIKHHGMGSGMTPVLAVENALQDALKAKVGSAKRRLSRTANKWGAQNNAAALT